MSPDDRAVIPNWTPEQPASCADPGSLYARLLGPAWPMLDHAVRQAHGSSRGAVGTGELRVQRGSGPFARLLAWALRLPTSADAVTTSVLINRTAAGERWRRRFERVELTSWQRAGANQTLLERVGPLEFRFRLVVESGRLLYQQTAVALVIGPQTWSLHRWLAPRVIAHESAGDQPGRTWLQVRLSLPWGAPLLRYAGLVAFRDEPA
jgi:uncharacterized protein DUF4166